MAGDDYREAGPRMFRLLLARGGRVSHAEWIALAKEAGYERGGPDVGGYKNAQRGGIVESDGYVTLSPTGWEEVGEVFESYLLGRIGLPR